MARSMLLAAVAVAALAAAGGAAADARGKHIAHAEIKPNAAKVAAPARPAEDVARDADRKPQEMLSFAKVKPGQKVLELLPGGGYFTRVLSAAVGPTGEVYAAAPAPTSPDAQPAVQKIAAEPGYGNIKPVIIALSGVAGPEPVDLIFTAQNYHDFHLARLKLDVPKVDKSLYDALKPGGALLVIDHRALDGAPLETADTLHRIDPAKAKAELEAVGFKLEAQSDALANPADPKTGNVFSPDIRGKTDQFVMLFRKPK